MSGFIQKPYVEVCCNCQKWVQDILGIGTCKLKGCVTEFDHICDEE